MKNITTAFVSNYNLWKNRKLDSKLVEDVNDFFNMNVVYMLDIDSVGKRDYWQCLSETLLTGVGDCDDFAIAKYMTLLKLRYPSDKMYLFYYKKSGAKTAHLALAVKMAKKRFIWFGKEIENWYVLDNTVYTAWKLADTDYDDEGCVFYKMTHQTCTESSSLYKALQRENDIKVKTYGMYGL